MLNLNDDKSALRSPGYHVDHCPFDYNMLSVYDGNRISNGGLFHGISGYC